MAKWLTSSSEVAGTCKATEGEMGKTTDATTTQKVKEKEA